MGPKGAIALAAHLTAPERLFLDANLIGDNGVRAVAGARQFATLVAVSLNACDVGVEGVEALTAASHLTALKELYLEGNKFRDAQATVDLLGALRSRVPDVVVSLRGNRLAWGDKPTISPSLLQAETNAKELMRMLLEFRGASDEFSFVRAVMAGTSGSGKTHLSRRFESPNDPSLNEPLPELERATKGIVRRRAKVDSGDLKVAGLPPRIWLMVQDVGGHTEQIKCHYHLAYLAGDSIFVLCVRMDDGINGWPRYYLHLLADLGRRAYNGQTGVPLPAERLPALEPDRKLKVLIVPTHRDRFDNADVPSQVRRNISRLVIPAVQKTLDVTVLSSTSCLDGEHVADVLTRLAKEIRKLPFAGALEKPYVEPILMELERALRPPAGGSGKLWKCSFRDDELRAIFAKHGEVNYNYMVHVILRTGLLVTPLDEVPLRESEVPHKAGLLLNPAFVNAFIYGTLIDGPRSNSWGFVKTNDLHAQMEPATPLERNAIIKALESHQVIIACKRDDGVDGYLVPDRFEMRPSGEFESWSSTATLLKVWRAENFVPEHALFDLMAHHRRLLEPIQRQGAEIKTYAYRNACRFEDGDAQVQVYLNVLSRKLYMCGKGEGAEALMTRLFDRVDQDRVHGWKEVPAECWRLRSEIQAEAIKRLNALIEAAGKTGAAGTKVEREREYRAAYRAILECLYTERDGEPVTKDDDEIVQGCALLGGSSKVKDWRKDLTDEKFLETSGGRKKSYGLTESGKALLECMDAHGNARFNIMPNFNPDEGALPA